MIIFSSCLQREDGTMIYKSWVNLAFSDNAYQLVAFLWAACFLIRLSVSLEQASVTYYTMAYGSGQYKNR